MRLGMRGLVLYRRGGMRLQLKKKSPAFMRAFATWWRWNSRRAASAFSRGSRSIRFWRVGMLRGCEDAD